MPPVDSYRHIIWDFNGTLLDDLAICLEIQKKMLAKYHLEPLSLARYRQTLDFPIRSWYTYLGYDTGRYEELAAEWTALFDEAAVSCGLCPGTLPLLELFKSRGIGQSILSASNLNQMNGLLRQLEIEPYFQLVLGLDNKLAESKLGLCEIFRREITVPPERILLIGDTTQDALTAGTLGCDCALLACGHQSRERLENTGAMVFDDHHALLRALTER